LEAARPFPTDTGSLFTFSDKPELVTARTSQELSETSLITAVPSQTSLPHNSEKFENTVSDCVRRTTGQTDKVRYRVTMLTRNNNLYFRVG